MYNAEIGVGCGSGASGCNGTGACPRTPDFCIKRHDTRPPFKISMSDCDGPIDLDEEGVVAEASMWFDAKLKSALVPSSTQIRFADDIGFESVLVGDTILTSRARSPEKMVVVSISESARTVTVSRGQNGTTAQAWEKGTGLRVFRFMDEPASIESIVESVESIDGAVSDELADTLLVFGWTPEQTSMPGCYWLEFKLLKISPGTSAVEWVKRVPLSSDGFVINIIDSPTTPA